MVARSSNYQIRECKLKNRSTLISAGPKLDRTSDASLEHKRKHGAAKLDFLVVLREVIEHLGVVVGHLGVVVDQLWWSWITGGGRGEHLGWSWST